MNVLTTQRLTLDELEAGDAPFILELLNDAGFLRYIGDKGVRTLADARRYLVKGPLDSYVRNGYGLYRVGLRSDGRPVGICGLVKRDGLPWTDLGFAFLAAHRGVGYATESARAVMAHGRDTLRLPRIVAITAVDNHQSRAVLEKVGLRFEREITLPGDDERVNLFTPPGVP